MLACFKFSVCLSFKWRCFNPMQENMSTVEVGTSTQKVAGHHTASTEGLWKFCFPRKLTEGTWLICSFLIPEFHLLFPEFLANPAHEFLRGSCLPHVPETTCSRKARGSSCIEACWRRNPSHRGNVRKASRKGPICPFQGNQHSFARGQ